MVEHPPFSLIIAGEASLIGILLFFAYKWYQNYHSNGRPVLRTLLATVICFNIWVLVIILQPLHLWQRIIAVTCVQYGALLFYIATKQMLKNEHPPSITRNKGFWITSLAIGSIVVLDIFLFSGTDPHPDITRWRYYTETALGYLYLLCWDILIIKVYLKVLRRNTHLVDIGRFGLCLLAFSLNFLGLLQLEASLLLAHFHHSDYAFSGTTLYYLILVVMATLLALSYILPEKFFIKVLYHFSLYKTFRQQQQQELLYSLHHAMVQIVPGVQLPCESVHNLRILIEISDARQVIWSLEQHLKPITPQAEAKQLLHLMSKKMIVTVPGIYSPPPTSIKNVIKHNITVAKRLQNLQKFA